MRISSTSQNHHHYNRYDVFKSRPVESDPEKWGIKNKGGHKEPERKFTDHYDKHFKPSEVSSPDKNAFAYKADPLEEVPSLDDVPSSSRAGAKDTFMPYGNALDPRNHAALRAQANTPAGKRIIAMADEALKASPDPIHGSFDPERRYVPGKDGVVNTNRDMSEINKMNKFATQMNSLNHAYAMTGDERYAEKATNLMDAWAKNMKPEFGSWQAGISSYHPLSSVFSSMTALKDYKGWEPEQKARAMKWVDTFADNAKNMHADNNNIHAWRTLFRGSAAALTGDTAGVREQANAMMKAMETQINGDGLMPKELKRTQSLHYHLYALQPMTAMAEVARSAGVDIYNTPAGQKLGKSLERVGEGLLDRGQWKYPESGNPGKGAAALYSIAASRFPQNENLKRIAESLAAREQKGDWVNKAVKGQMDDGSLNGFPIPSMYLFQ
ncbi:hypothetical protein CYFUS_006788 [Cystobacter fuscus]|uniref:Alginate lyase domain-containing protein n=1 Tax=Cystobacter fuscus TaxID=43 RepID=A0A250JCI9_9BACT|nr:alginate lyase family protein [Cystobacter fuscus]ATB41323.1 hypothetical protein CYFUS_006788 [Cystobacter fuscus]